MYAIETKALTKQYKDVTAVNNLELTVREGELFALLGVNGAGKTTTIKMLSCLTKPTSGDAVLLGKSITAEPEAVKRLIAVSPQETAVAPKLTVRENLEMMAEIADCGKAEGKERIRRLSEAFGLEPVMKKPAGKLSGKILFLDEPTLGLDVLARSELWEVIRDLKGKITVILTTHYMEEAEALSDRIGVMGAGHLLCVGTAEELKAQTGKETLEEAFIALAKEARK